MNTPAVRKFSPGFTIIELMVVLAIVSILLALAVPSMVDMRQRSDVVRFSSALQESLNSARMQAINGGDEVSVCASSDGQHCDGTWGGWLVFQGDVPATTVPITDPVAQHSLSGVTIDGPNSITFDGIGASNSSFLARICDTSDTIVRAIHVSILGRVRSSMDSDHDGVHESPVDGTALTCS